MIKIEKGVPMPPKVGGMNGLYPFSDMSPGDSFALPLTDKTIEHLRSKLSACANGWAKRHAPGAKFATRIEDGRKSVRIWLLIKPAPLAPLPIEPPKVHKIANREDERFDAGGRASPARRDGSGARVVQGKGRY